WHCWLEWYWAPAVAIRPNGATTTARLARRRRPPALTELRLSAVARRAVAHPRRTAVRARTQPQRRRATPPAPRALAAPWVVPQAATLVPTMAASTTSATLTKATSTAADRCVGAVRTVRLAVRRRTASARAAPRAFAPTSSRFPAP